MAVPSYTGRNRGPAKGGPSGVQRSYASELRETEALFNSYEHLQGLPRGDAALTMLRKVASLVKPIMRKRHWRVQILAEFLPPEQNLLGLNINKGYKICIRLRYHNNPDLFLPIEQVVDTMLHELSHNVWGDHDSNFHRLWDELRDEHETLIRKGYTGEGFLSEGHKLGGGRFGVPPPHEMRRLARASAEKRQAQGTLSKGSGQRLGGTPLHAYGRDARQVIADSVSRRNTIDRGCASGRQDAGKLADEASNHTFKTKAEEDDANDRAIAQALFELMEQEEERKLTNGTFATAPTDGGLAWHPETGLYDPGKGHRPSPISPNQMSEEEQMKWAMRDSMPSGWPDRTSQERSPVSPMTPDGGQRGSIDSAVSSQPAPAPTEPHSLFARPQSQADATSVTRPTRDVEEKQVVKPQQPAHSASTPRPPALRQGSVVSPTTVDISEPFNPDEWTCEICTCINPMQFLACDACGCERPQAATDIANSSASTATRTSTVAARTNKPRWTVAKPAQDQRLGWNCTRCGSFMEHKWWTCSACGLMKSES